METPPELPPDPPVPLRFRTLLALVTLPLGVMFVVAAAPFDSAHFSLRDAGPFLILGTVLLLILAGPPYLLGRFLAWLGRRRRWSAKIVRWFAVGCTLAWAAAVTITTVRSYTLVRNSSKVKAMIPGQQLAGMDQFFLENEDRIFVTYGELVGPQAYIKAIHPVDGEDPGALFPLRRYLTEPLPVRLPDGSTVKRYEVLAVISPAGLIATYPQAQDGAFFRERVYRLDNGVTYRADHVVNEPPDPAGREGRDQDGVHTYRLPDGRRYEITYHGGAPDGSFRAFYKDGAPWGEATYRQGRLVEAWVITRQGRRFDELHDGPAACAAMIAEAKAAAEKFAQPARARLAAKDYAGAIAGFTAALELDKDGASYLGRADARLALGDLDGAIQDCKSARDCAAGPDAYNFAEQKLKELQKR